MQGMFARYKLAVLAVLMCSLFSAVPNHATESEFKPFTGALKKGFKYLGTWEGKCVAILSAMYIRLNTKGSSWDYKFSDWRDDLESLISCVKVWNPESYKTIAYLFDKWVIGRALKIIEIKYDDINRDGKIISAKDKKVVTGPFGLFGFFDAYVILQLKGLIEVGGNVNIMQNYTTTTIS